MISIHKSLFKIVKSNQDVISWKLKKSFSEFEVGFWIILVTLFLFYVGVILFSIFFHNSPIINVNLTFPIILNLILVFIDFTVISITFNWQIHNKHLDIPNGELFRKRKQILLLFFLIIVFVSIFLYWVPVFTGSFVIEIIYGIVVIVELIFLSIYHFLTWFMATLSLAMFKGKETITINYNSKFITKEKRTGWKKSVERLDFDELTSLTVRSIEIRKMPYLELVLICNEKSFQIVTGPKEFLRDYATQLQKVLNLPIVTHQ